MLQHFISQPWSILVPLQGCWPWAWCWVSFGGLKCWNFPSAPRKMQLQTTSACLQLLGLLLLITVVTLPARWDGQSSSSLRQWGATVCRQEASGKAQGRGSTCLSLIVVCSLLIQCLYMGIYQAETHQRLPRAGTHQSCNSPCSYCLRGNEQLRLLALPWELWGSVCLHRCQWLAWVHCPLVKNSTFP